MHRRITASSTIPLDRQCSLFQPRKTPCAVIPLSSTNMSQMPNTTSQSVNLHLLRLQSTSTPRPGHTTPNQSNTNQPQPTRQPSAHEEGGITQSKYTTSNALILCPRPISFIIPTIKHRVSSGVPASMVAMALVVIRGFNLGAPRHHSSAVPVIGAICISPLGIVSEFT